MTAVTSLVRRAACLGLLLAAAATGACGRTTTASSAYVDTQPPPEEPMVMDGDIGTYGGRIVVPGDAPPTGFNPVTATTVGTNEIAGLLFVRLTRMDGRTQAVVPSLASAWETSADGLAWTFHIRKGARFSDGHPITAEDVLFSFSLMYDPAIPTGRSELQSGGVNWTVASPDQNTVVITTGSPVANLAPLMTRVAILPKHVLEGSWHAGTFAASYGLSTPPERLVTSGAWQLKSYAANERTVLTRNPYWFGTDREHHRLPYLDELVLLVSPDHNATDLKFRSGELDVLPRADPETFQWYEQHQSEGNFTLYDVGPPASVGYVAFNLMRTPSGSAASAARTPKVGAVKYAWFNDVRFRRAVSKAVDRDAMIKSLMYGAGVKVWSTTTSADKQWYTPEVKHDDYDVDGARALLSAIGMRDRNGDGVVEDPSGHDVAFTLATNPSNPIRMGMANFVRDDLAKVGIKVTVAAVEFNTLVTSLRSGDFDATLFGIGFGTVGGPTAGSVLLRSSSNLHLWNPSQPTPSTPEEAHVDDLLNRMASTLDDAQRRVMWRELQDLVNEQAWLVWLPVASQKIPVRNRLGNVFLFPMSIGSSALLWNSPQLFVTR